MRRSLYIIAALVLVVGLVGCGGSDNGDPVNGDPINGDPIDQALVGEWQIFEALLDGENVAPGEAMGWDENEVRMTINFGADGSITERLFESDGSVADTSTGTWTAEAGEFAIEFGDEDPVAGTYTVDENILTVTIDAPPEAPGEQLLLRWVRVAELTERDQALVRGWNVSDVRVNGVDVAPADFFKMGNADDFVMAVNDDGSFVIYALDGIDIEGIAAGSWATGGGAIALIVDGAIMLGTYSINSASLTFLDVDGSTVQFGLEAFAPAGERDASLVGQWETISATVDGEDVPLGLIFDWAEEDGTDRMLIHFYPDGTVVTTDYAGEDLVSGEVGTWNSDAGVLTLNLDEPVVMNAWDVVGNVLTTELTLLDDFGDPLDVVLTFERI